MAGYVAVIERDGDGFMVSFPDFPGVFSQGTDLEDAVRHGRDALETALADLAEFGRCESFPAPSKLVPGRDQHWIELPASFSAKLLLVAEMNGQEVSQVELANRLHLAKQEMTRLLDLRHTSKIDTIARALGKLGKRLELRVR
jgi:antitoxin HicB